MNRADHTRSVELNLAWLVAAAVAFTGLYDFTQGSAPRGLFNLNAQIGLAAFLVGCLTAAVLATVLATTVRPHSRSLARTALLAGCFLPMLFTDPTYGSLMLVIPIIDIRRRDAQPVRTIWVVGILLIVGLMLVTEDTPPTGGQFETMLGIAIAFLVVVLLGDALRELDKRLVTEADLAQLSERNRLAEELHDGLGHHLLASSVQLQKAKALRERDPESSATAVAYASEAIAEAISETRLIVDTTRQDIQFALEPSIRELARRIVPAETTMEIQITGDHQQLDATTQVTIYRVVQEALTNLVRHSAATHAHISSAATADSVAVSIADNGAGFDVAGTMSPGGISNMRKRVENLGGTFTIESAPDGTSVAASVPQ